MDAKVAVVLVGGNSSRMGSDKCLLEMNGMPQWKHMMQELQLFFNDVYISCKGNQQTNFPNEQLILDSIEDIGPMGAIYSAFNQLKSTDTIFFVSCDLPNFKVNVAECLYEELSFEYDICAAQSTVNPYPEPLVAIWKRSTLPTLTQFISEKNYALFKAMRTLRVKSVQIQESHLLKNVNRPSDL